MKVRMLRAVVRTENLIRILCQSPAADASCWRRSGSDWFFNGLAHIACENTVELLKLIASKKKPQLTTEHQRVITAIADVLIDNGVRGASFFRQELWRATRNRARPATPVDPS